MKNRYLLLCIFWAVSCGSIHKDTTLGALTLPSMPRVGKQMLIRYRLDSNLTSDNKDIHISLYYAVKDNIYAKSLQPSDTGTVMTALFTLPDSAQAFALKFKNHHSVINGRHHYIFPVYDRDGKPVAGSGAGMSLFYLNEGSDLLGLATDQDSALKLMQGDFTAHPEIKRTWMLTYLSTLLAVKKNSAYSQVQAELQQLLSDDVREGDYATAYALYLQMDSWNQADSVMRVGVQQFPKGDMAMQAALSHLYSLRYSVDSMTRYYRHFKEAFPAANNKSASSRIRNRMLGVIATWYSDQGFYQQYRTFLSQITDPVIRAESYNFLAAELKRNHSHMLFADSIFKVALELVEREMRKPGPEKPAYQTVDDWREDMRNRYIRFANGYALWLSKEGRSKEAVAYQQKVVMYSGEKNPYLNERYIQYLLDAKDYQTAQKKLEAFIIRGETTAKSDQYLKPLYIRFNHTEAGFTAYHNALKEKAEANLKGKLGAKLAAEMVQEPAPDFRLPDLKGNMVSLSDLRGKTVVLDFWATWCAPCRASMPGMQKIVNEFRNDSNVVFLFVDTQETTSAEQRHKTVSGFIKNHHYSFRVLLDQHKASSAKEYQMASDYHLSPIPAKFVIDPQGYIRFKTVGFGGNGQSEALELAMMIEMARS